MKSFIGPILMAAAIVFLTAASLTATVSQAAPSPLGGIASETAVSCTAVPPHGSLVGRFVIPSVGVDVACYSGMEQAVVDAADSAAYFSVGSHTIIGDHVHQGFATIKNTAPGAQAKLITESGEDSYVCADIIQGRNTGTELTDAEGTPITHLHPDALVCYTCHGGSDGVMILFFTPDTEAAMPPNDHPQATPVPISQEAEPPQSPVPAAAPNITTAVTQLDGIDVVISPIYTSE